MKKTEIGRERMIVQTTVVWCAVLWYCVMWCIVVWCMCCIVWCAALCDVLCCGIVWCAVLWYCVMCCIVVWCDMVCCVAMWCIVVMCDLQFFLLCCCMVWARVWHTRSVFLCERPRAKKITCRVRIPNTTSKLLFYGGRSLASFSIFTSNLENKTVDFNEIWTRIVVVRGKLDNHLNWCSCNFLLVCGKRPWRRVRLYL